MWIIITKEVMLICNLKTNRKFTFEELNQETTNNENIESKVWKYIQKNNLGKRGKFDGNQKQQFYGLLTQTVISQKLGQPILSVVSGFDNGIDIFLNNYTIDVKTSLRNVTITEKNNYPANLLDSQYRGKQYKNNFYIFCSYNVKENIIQILGILKKEDVEKLGKYFSPNDKSYNRTGKPIDVKEPRWEIPISSLIPVNSIEDIKDYFK